MGQCLSSDCWQNFFPFGKLHAVGRQGDNADPLLKLRRCGATGYVPADMLVSGFLTGAVYRPLR